jgi:hypothetical protein
MIDRSKAGVARQPTFAPRQGFNLSGTYADASLNAMNLRRILETACAAKPQRESINPIAFMTGSRPDPFDPRRSAPGHFGTVE